MKKPGISNPYFAMKAWKWKIGYKEDFPLPFHKTLTLKEAYKNWNELFIKYMRNRMLVGAYRYGILNSPGKPTYNSILSAIKRLQLYQKTGNTEYLVDVANLCMVEFAEGIHPKKHFLSIDDGEHSNTK